MAVIRNRYNSKTQFVILDRSVLWNENLSLKAIGLWGRCISRPDNWIFSITEMSKNGKEKETAIYSAINELKEINLCVYIQHRIQGTVKGKKVNKIFSTEYFFFQVPLTQEEKDMFIKEQKEEFKKFLQDRGFLDPGFLDQGNQALTNNYSKYIEGNKQTEVDVLSAKSEEKEEYLSNGMLSIKQKKKLEKNFTPEEIQKSIDFLSLQNTIIDNPYGWIKSCLEKKWYEKKLQQTDKKDENKKKAIEYELFCQGKLKNNAQVQVGSEGFLIFRGEKTIEIKFADLYFENRCITELEKMGVLYVERKK